MQSFIRKLFFSLEDSTRQEVLDLVQPEPLKNVKVLLLGPSCGGKTTLYKHALATFTNDITQGIKKKNTK